MEIKRVGVNDLFNDTLWWASVADHEDEVSRNGPVRTFQEPLTICNTRPRERVLLNPHRNANPFFQLMECVWMFAGDRSDWIVKFNKRMASYMDYGNFHGAYGSRWANHWNIDQVVEVIKLLKETPNTRRAYISLWDPDADLNMPYKDLPCNVGMAFQTRKGRLNGYVFNRSNDLIWGMLGTNCVHFSMLLELVAECAEMDLGYLYQTTINPHIYEHHWDYLANPARGHSPNSPACRPLDCKDYKLWVQDARMFLELDTRGTYAHDWFAKVAAPMYDVYINRNWRSVAAIECPAWRYAASMWWGQNRREPAPAPIPQPKVGVGDQGVE